MTRSVWLSSLFSALKSGKVYSPDPTCLDFALDENLDSTPGGGGNYYLNSDLCRDNTSCKNWFPASFFDNDNIVMKTISLF